MAKAAASIVMLATLPDAVPSLEAVVSNLTSRILVDLSMIKKFLCVIVGYNFDLLVQVTVDLPEYCFSSEFVLAQIPRLVPLLQDRTLSLHVQVRFEIILSYTVDSLLQCS